MAYRVLGALLRGGALIGGSPDGYTFVFYFFFRFWEIFKHVWPIKELPWPILRKPQYNPIYPGLDIYGLIYG